MINAITTKQSLYMAGTFGFKEHCDLFLYLLDKLDSYWKRLYYSTMTIVGALLGGNYLKVDSWLVITILTIMFLAFSVSNLFDHLRVYKFLLIVLKKLDKDKDKIDNEELVMSVRKLPYSKEVILCKISYLSVMTSIIVMVLVLKGIITW